MTYIGYPYDESYFHDNGSRSQIGYTDYTQVEAVQRGVANDIEALLGTVDGLRILDAGCAYGYLVDELARRGANVTGLDSSAYAIGRARALFPTRDFVEADISVSGFADQTFDMIVCCGLADCIPASTTRQTIFAEMKRMLRQGGKVYILTSFHHPIYITRSRKSWIAQLSKLFPGHTVSVENVGHLPLGYEARCMIWP